MMFLFYNIIIFILTPVWLAVLWKKQGSYLRLHERLGFLPKSISPVIWIHGVSLGEAKISLKLANLLKNKGYQVFLTSTTKAGLGQLEKESVAFSAFPLDLVFFQMLTVSRVKPRAVILLETEIWPSLLNVLAKRNIPTFIVNARLSDKKLSNYLKLKNFFRSTLEKCWISASSEENTKRFLSFGLDPSKVISQANMKFDLARGGNVLKSNEALVNALSAFLPDAKIPVWIAGSVREGEEEIILSCHSAIRQKINSARLILAPRHLERVGAVLELCWKKGLKPKLRTEFPEKEWDVLILDTYGELQSCYSLASVAFMGGSILNHGGQNPLEPAGSGTPVLFGSHMENFADEAKALVNAGAAEVIGDPEAIPAAISRILTDDSSAEIMGRNALILMNNACGSSERTVDWIIEKL